MKNGYVVVDCGGLDLTGGSTPQTIKGLYERLVEVMRYGKPIIISNIINGTGKPITPVSAFAFVSDTDEITLTISTLDIVVTDDATGNVTIESLVTANRSTSKK